MRSSVLLVLAACGAPAAAVEPDLSNAGPHVTFVELVNGARAVAPEEIDGVALGDHVEAYLVSQSGAWLDDHQRMNLVLVLVGEGGVARVALDQYDAPVPGHPEFGTLAVVPACDQADAAVACQGFAWMPARPLIAADVRSSFGDPERWSVSLEGDLLVLVGSSATDPSSYERDEIALAPGARVTAPTPVFEQPELDGTVVVAGTEVDVGGDPETALYDLWLRVGDRFGPLWSELADKPDPGRWQASERSDLKMAPVADEHLASRVYRRGDHVSLVILARDADDLVVWHRAYGDSVVSEWREAVRVPLPRDAQIVLP